MACMLHICTVRPPVAASHMVVMVGNMLAFSVSMVISVIPSARTNMSSAVLSFLWFCGVSTIVPCSSCG